MKTTTNTTHAAHVALVRHIVRSRPAAPRLTGISAPRDVSPDFDYEYFTPAEAAAWREQEEAALYFSQHINSAAVYLM